MASTAVRSAPQLLSRPRTSTEVGHSYRVPDPVEDIPQLFSQTALPPCLAVSPAATSEQTFTTTYRDLHHYKHPSPQYLHSRYDPPLKLDRVIYLKDFLEKIKRNSRLCWIAGNRPSKTGLTEKQEKFVRHPIATNEGKKSPVPTGGSLPQSISEPPLPSAILRELDPYISTTNKDHRQFNEAEVTGALTYKLPVPIPSRLVQYKPMMTPDKPKSNWTAAHPRPVAVIPASGMTTETREAYRPGVPCDSAMFMAMVGTGNVDCAPARSVPGGKLAVMDPFMYATESSNIGSGQVIVLG